MIRVRALAALAVGLAASACAGPGFYEGSLPAEPGRNMASGPSQAPVQCAPYAREHSGVKIYGDAYTWWDQAQGRFTRNPSPDKGAVMVLADYAGPKRGHLAVVKTLVAPREIRVDHANWLNDGSIYVNNPVADVSAANDWSAVKVWNIKTGRWGERIYSVKGFIGPDAAPPGRIALAQDLELPERMQ